MNCFAKIPIPHSRLLYASRPIAELSSWQGGLAQVESEIFREYNMGEANSFVYLYFFLPSEEWTPREEYWVGREVVGIRRGKSDETALWEREAGHCYRAVLGHFLKDGDIFLERERELREIYRAEYSCRPAASWRIGFDSERPEQIFLEFFGKS